MQTNLRINLDGTYQHDAEARRHQITLNAPLYKETSLSLKRKLKRGTYEKRDMPDRANVLRPNAPGSWTL